MANSEPGDRPGRVSPNPPPTPEGYDDPYLFEYSTVLLVLLSVPVGILSFFGFGRVLWAAQGPAVFEAAFDVTETGDAITVTTDVAGVAVPFLVALFVVAVVHELIHGAVLRYYGKEVTYGVNPAMGAFYTSAFGQFQDTRELFPVAVAPLAVITLAGIPLLWVPAPAVVLTVYLALVFNATGSVGDLFLLWRLNRMPRGTLMYDADLRHWWVFEPLD